MGGRRFRPTLGDIIEFLSQRNLSNHAPVGNVLEDGRAEFREEALASLAAYLRCRVMIQTAATGSARPAVRLVVDDLTMARFRIQQTTVWFVRRRTLASHNFNAYRPFARSSRCDGLPR